MNSQTQSSTQDNVGEDGEPRVTMELGAMSELELRREAKTDKLAAAEQRQRRAVRNRKRKKA